VEEKFFLAITSWGDNDVVSAKIQIQNDQFLPFGISTDDHSDFGKNEKK